MSRTDCGRHLSDEMRRVLDESGLPWELVRRRRHVAVVLCGRVVQLLSTSASERSAGRHALNALACVRRAVRGELERRGPRP